MWEEEDTRRLRGQEEMRSGEENVGIEKENVRRRREDAHFVYWPLMTLISLQVLKRNRYYKHELDK